MKEERPVNLNKLLLRVLGDLPSDEELFTLLGVRPTSMRRRGEPIKVHNTVQELDVWVLELIEREQWTKGLPTARALQHATDTLEQLAPKLASLDRSRSAAQL